MNAEAASELVLFLGDGPAADPQVAGQKAATLSRLRAHGFPVPFGFVLTVDGVSRIPADGGAVPSDVRAALAVGLGAHGERAFAVRSSGVSEDLPGASFAGQYETVLGVQGLDGVVEAVRRCRASASSRHASAYRSQTGTADARIAVLVQHLVSADAAGVAFTANPVTGDPETLVSAVRGTGERLVAGEATPDEWVVRGADATSVGAAEGAIDADQATRVARLAQSVEEVLGRPQDVEWAIADDVVYLLQARPITALPRPPELDPLPDGFWLKDDSHHPTPLTPFGASVYLPAAIQGAGPVADRFGFLVEGVDQRSRGGEVYVRAIPLGGKEREAPPPWVLWLVSRLVPAMRRCARAAEEALRTDAARQLVDSWNGGWRDEFRLEAAKLGRRELTQVSDEDLLAHLDAAQGLLNRGQQAHLLLWAAYTLPLYELACACEELLGWGPADTLALVTGTSAASSEPGRALAELTTAIGEPPAARDIVSTGGADVRERLREAAPAAAAAFEAYLEQHGRRTLSYDPGDVTLAERPELLAGLVSDRLSGVAHSIGDPGAIRREALTRARAILGASTEEQRARFERALTAAENAYPCREDNIIWTDNVPSGLLRFTAIEIGRRLAAREAIAHADDAVFLEEKELRAALRGHDADLRELIARRRSERAWVIAHPGPPSYGVEPATPDLRGLPPALRHVTRALMWFMELFSQPPAEAPTDAVVGVPGSPGVHSGPVRVIREQSEFGLLRPGDVLVCPITSPSWSILFAQAGAVVTDGGGVLAHAAVIAREYGIPAVLATGDATRRLRDGQIVTVDGAAGIVRSRPARPIAAPGPVSRPARSG